MAEGRRGRGAELIGRSLPGVIAGLLPRLRRVEALKRFQLLLPPEIQELAAASEIRLQARSERKPGEMPTQVSTLHVYCASAAVAAVIEQREQTLLAELNGQLPYPLVEALHCEVAALHKITQQLNNLAFGPD